MDLNNKIYEKTKRKLHNSLYPSFVDNLNTMSGMTLPPNHHHHHSSLTAAFHNYHSAAMANNNFNLNQSNDNDNENTDNNNSAFLLPAQLYKSLFVSAAVLQKSADKKSNSPPFPRNLLFSCSEKSPNSDHSDLNEEKVSIINDEVFCC